MNAYIPRIIDTEIDELLPALPALSLEGPRGVGKTETATRRARTVFALDSPTDRELVLSDNNYLEKAVKPILIDEWQREPSVWDLVRRSVDKNPQGGKFILTGSASPTQAPLHSGAGRIVQIRMRPLSLTERQIVSPTISLRDLLSGNHPDIDGFSTVTVSDYANEIASSGFPAIRQLQTRARQVQLSSYVARIVEKDFLEQGLHIRRPQTVRAWLSAYAAATATTASYSTILQAATPGDSDKPAKTTTSAYRDVLHSLWLLDPVPGWIPLGNSFARLATAPKHHLADPALAAILLGINPATLRFDAPTPRINRTGTLLGGLFESLVTQSVKVYAQPSDATVSHLRTSNGHHEVDLIVERPDRAVVALEVKLTAHVNDDDVAHLLWLRNRLGDDLLDAAIITTGERAYRRKDGIAVIPAALLGP